MTDDMAPLDLARAAERAARLAYEAALAADAPNPRDYSDGQGGYDGAALDAALDARRATLGTLYQQWEAAAAVRRTLWAAQKGA